MHSDATVISDYVPRSSRGAARGAMLAASVVAAVGLLKVRSAPLARWLYFVLSVAPVVHGATSKPTDT